MNKLPYAWAVEFVRNGETFKFITLERSRADQYAVERHGIIKKLYYDDVPIVLETKADEPPPWEEPMVVEDIP